jgi:hypothetical protein
MCLSPHNACNRTAFNTCTTHIVEVFEFEPRKLHILSTGSDMWCAVHAALATYRVIMDCAASDESGAMLTGHNHHWVDTKNPPHTREIYGTKDDG